MPKRKIRSEQYINDEGVIVNKPQPTDTSGSNTNPNKKPKVEEKKEEKGPSHTRSQPPGPNTSSAVSAAPPPGGGQLDKEGGVFWEISEKRRVQVTTYAGKEMVGIREYYEKGGEMLPGKRGISLPMDQFTTLVALLPSIETVLKGRGHDLVRPEYGDGGAGDGEMEAVEAEEEEGGGDEEDQQDMEDEEVEGEEVREKGKTKKMKKNFEDTSEDE